MTTLADLRKMTDDQLCRWVCCRRGVFNHQEREALKQFMRELPNRAEAIPAEWLKGVA